MPLEDLITEELLNEELERAKQHREWWKLYEGKHPDSVPVVIGKEGKPEVNDNVKYNLLGLTVDKGVAFLFGGEDQDVGMSLDEEDARSPDEEYLDAVWNANGKKLFLQKVATNGGVCGHFFVRLFEDGALGGSEFPRMVNLDPSYCVPICEEDDYEKIVGYKIQYPTTRKGARVVRRTLIEQTPGGEWEIRDQVSTGPGRTDWQEMNAPVRWLYDFPPIIDGQNLPCSYSYWGRSDMEGGVEDLNMSVNRALTSMQRILRHHGHPKAWTSGVTEDQVTILTQGVDRLLLLPEGATLNQLALSGALSDSIEFYRQLRSAFAEIARNPQVDPEKMGSIGALSGLALQILYTPLLEKTGVKRGTYGDWLRRANRALLEIGGKAPQDTSIGWPSPLPKDEAAETSALTTDVTVFGVSKETALEKRGYDPEVEKQRKEQEGGQATDNLDNVLEDPLLNAGGLA